MTKNLLAIALAGALSVGTLTACGGDRVIRDTGPRSCPVGQVLEIDGDGRECEPDRNRNGIDDEDESKKKKSKKKSKAKKSAFGGFKSKAKSAGSSFKKSSGSVRSSSRR